MKVLQLFLVLVLLISVGSIVPIYAQICYDCDETHHTTNNTQQNQVELTDKGSIKVGFYTDPEKPSTSNQTKFSISFLNKDTDLIQQHIDYKVSVMKGADQVYGIPVAHTAEGTIKIPFQFTGVGTYQIVVEVDGILFQPITPETATFTVDVGSSAVPEFPASTAIILVFGITSIIVLSARSKLIPTNYFFGK